MALSKPCALAYHDVFIRRVHQDPEYKARRRGAEYWSSAEVWMLAFDIAAEDNISPWDALLKAVRRRSARVRVIDGIIDAAWKQHRELCKQHDGDPEWNPDVPPDSVRAWLTESRNEERLLTRTSKMAIDAGVAKMLIERDQLEGRLLADALVAGLDALNLTTDQRMLALGEAQRALEGIAGNGGHVIEGDAVIPGIQLDKEQDGDDA